MANPAGAGQTIRIGTRGSALARAQTRLVVQRLLERRPGVEVGVEVIRTEGDLDRMSPLTEIGGRGVFTNVLELAVLEGRIDAAVHSAKDLPSALHPSIPIVAIPDRDDPRDVLVSRHQTTLDRLPPRPVIGTSSRRREVQIRRWRPDARLVSIRGNIDTRLRKAATEEYDGIVLAAAGLRRMGWEDRASEFFPVDRVVPSPGQGAIAVQAKGGTAASALLEAIDDGDVALPVRIERDFLSAIGAGCAMPVGAYVCSERGALRLVAMVADADGVRIATADEPLQAGDEHEHAAEIARRLLGEVTPVTGRTRPAVRAWPRDLAGARVVVTRARGEAESLFAELVERGADVVALPTIRVEACEETSALDAALTAAQRGEFAWLVFTSANGVRVTTQRMRELGVVPSRLAGVRVAAVGPATAGAVREAGFTVSLVPRVATAEGLAAELVPAVGGRGSVLYPRSAIGREVLPDALRAAGADVTVLDVYRTVAESEVDPATIERIQNRHVDALAFFSPSGARHFLRHFDDRTVLDDVAVICNGPVTAGAARDEGLRVAAISDDPGDAAMADAIAKEWSLRQRLARAGLAAAPSTSVPAARGGWE